MLITDTNLASPDDFYEALIDTHRDLSLEQSQELNAALILLLANHLGDMDLLREALRQRAPPSCPPEHPGTVAAPRGDGPVIRARTTVPPRTHPRSSRAAEITAIAVIAALPIHIGLQGRHLQRRRQEAQAEGRRRAGGQFSGTVASRFVVLTMYGTAENAAR